jgi:hypothetical protein
MTLTKVSLVLAFAALVIPSSVHAQARTCLDPQHTVESLKEWLSQSAAAPRGDVAVSSIIANGVFGDCPVLPPDETDLNVVLDNLVRWAADQGEPALANGLMRGLNVGLVVHSERLGLDIPLTALSYAVSEGRNDRTRGYSLRTLKRLAEDPLVRSQLLQWAREPQGPPLFPDLPEKIARSLYHVVSINRADLLRGELEAEPSRIRNARVRCWAEGKDRPGAGRRPGAAILCPD